MKRFFTGLAAAALAITVGFSGIAPASATPLPTVSVNAGSSAVPVQYNPDAPPPRRLDRDRRGRGNDRPGYRNSDRPGFRRGPPRDRRGSWHGYRGYEQRRPGYRRHSDGFWYPLGAFRIQIR